jgi:hypothetical protein
VALASGTQTVLSTGTGAPLPAGPCRDLTIHNDDAAIVIKLGTAAAQNFTLGPGQSVYVQVANRNMVYAKAVSGSPILSYLSE